MTLVPFFLLLAEAHSSDHELLSVVGLYHLAKQYPDLVLASLLVACLRFCSDMTFSIRQTLSLYV